MKLRIKKISAERKTLIRSKVVINECGNQHYEWNDKSGLIRSL